MTRIGRLYDAAGNQRDANLARRLIVMGQARMVGAAAAAHARNMRARLRRAARYD